MICKNNSSAALEHTGMSCTFTNAHCFGLSGYSWGGSFLRYHHKYNPHHPEALFLGILGRLFGEARHYWERVCLREGKIVVCVI